MGEKSVQNKKISKVYEYRDEKEKLLFQCIKYKPKAFKQRRSDGKGGYFLNLKGMRGVLCRLPELIQTERHVFICGDEKDTGNLGERFNLTATTCPTGAENGKSRRKNITPSLEGGRLFSSLITMRKVQDTQIRLSILFTG